KISYAIYPVLCFSITVHRSILIPAPRPSPPLFRSLYEQRYANEPFVDALPAGELPQTRTVKGSNVCRISVFRPQDRDTVVVLSRSEEHTSELQSRENLVCRLLLEYKTRLELYST